MQGNNDADYNFIRKSYDDQPRKFSNSSQSISNFMAAKVTITKRRAENDGAKGLSDRKKKILVGRS